MKRSLLLTISTIALAFTSQAQISRGTVLLGGSVGASTYKSKAGLSEYRFRGFLLSPSFGFVVKNNNVIGLRLSYGHGKGQEEHNQNNSQYKNSSNEFGGGLFYRRYLPVANSFYFFGQSDAGYRYSKSEQSYNGNNENRNEWNTASISIYPGIAYVVSKRFHIELTLNNLLALNYTKHRYKREVPFDPAEGDKETLAFHTSRISLSNLAAGFRITLGK